ncbi:MAG: RNA polymerase sigma factor [Lachnospiraceae bacterium]|nr:RNA polymerase sigma factor [Lachnospiraceae bacterium]
MEIQEYKRLTSLYIDMVYRVALNGCKNKYDADDIVQETFLKLLRCRKQFESDEHARNWLIRVAINECNSMWNSSWRKKVILTDEQEDKPVFSTPEQSELYELVMQMSPKYRQVIYLYYFEGFSAREVASILKISETAVQTRLQRARNKLKEQLGGMI